MTVWELAACVEAVNRSNGAEESLDPPSNEEFDAMLERFDQRRAIRQ